MSKRSKVLEADYFAGFNTILFLIMCWTVYYDRLVEFRGKGNIHEFFLYACAILTTIIVIWYFLRKLSFPTWLLVFVEIGIFLHFAGGFVQIDHGRLYDAHMLGIRFDKYVHLFNSMAGAALTYHLLHKTGSTSPLLSILVILTVLGAGAIVEIIEYLVSLTVTTNGVGSYDNNMQDLIANLVGTLVLEAMRRGYLLARSGRRVSGHVPAE